MFSRCPICGEFRWYDSSHRCPPAWECSRYADADGGDWTAVYADDEESAAVKFIESVYESDDAKQAEVFVRKPGAATALRFIVQIEMVPSFHADAHETVALNKEE